MKQMFELIASFVHGNALGVVLEPAGLSKYFADFERPQAWIVRIGPLVPEAAIGTDFPKEDYGKVVAELVAFCKKHGIDHQLSVCKKPFDPDNPPDSLKKES